MKITKRSIEFQIIHLYQADIPCSTNKLAKMFSLGQTTVLRILKRNNITIRQRKDYSFTAWNKGKKGVQKMSEETKSKISVKLKGRVGGMKGKKHTEATKEKMSEIKKKHLPVFSFKKGHISWSKGKKTGIVPKSAFKLGHTPWNKNLKGFRVGEKNNNWKGGITSVHLQIRHSLKYKLWRQLVFERDNYVCQKCGQIGGQLHVDHWLKTFSEIIRTNNIQSMKEALNCKELWDIDNGRTLCINCHKKTDTYLKGGRPKLFLGIDKYKAICYTLI